MELDAGAEVIRDDFDIGADPKSSGDELHPPDANDVCGADDVSCVCSTGIVVERVSDIRWGLSTGGAGCCCVDPAADDAGREFDPPILRVSDKRWGLFAGGVCCCCVGLDANDVGVKFDPSPGLPPQPP